MCTKQGFQPLGSTEAFSAIRRVCPTTALKLNFNTFRQRDLDASSPCLQSWLLQSSGQPPRAERHPDRSPSVLAAPQPSLPRLNPPDAAAGHYNTICNGSQGNAKPRLMTFAGEYQGNKLHCSPKSLFLKNTCLPEGKSLQG